jgi:hypothetical protein
MLEDSRFWLALVLYFLSSTISGVHWSKFRHKRYILPIVYFCISLFCSVGLWLSMSSGVTMPGVFSLSNAAAVLLGLLCGISYYTFPLLFLFPFILSFSLKVPLTNFHTEEQMFLGELQFYPSNEGSLSLQWTSSDKEEHIIQLKGEKAAVVFVKRDVSEGLFFLESRIEALGILSRPVSMPLSELPEESNEWFYSLRKEDFNDSKIYQYSYPGLKFLKSGFFDTWSYLFVDEQVQLIRK